jgi:hypothetical protein
MTHMSIRIDWSRQRELKLEGDGREGFPLTASLTASPDDLWKQLLLEVQQEWWEDPAEDCWRGLVRVVGRRIVTDGVTVENAVAVRAHLDALVDETNRRVTADPDCLQRRREEVVAEIRRLLTGESLA